MIELDNPMHFSMLQIEKEKNYLKQLGTRREIICQSPFGIQSNERECSVMNAFSKGGIKKDTIKLSKGRVKID